MLKSHFSAVCKMMTQILLSHETHTPQSERFFAVTFWNFPFRHIPVINHLSKRSLKSSLSLSYSAFFSLIVCAYPEWRKNDLQGQVIETQQVKQGIWWNCMHFATGQWHCDDYDRVLLGLPAELQAARALMVLSNVLGFFGYLLSQFGLSCTRFMEDNPEGKRKCKYF